MRNWLTFILILGSAHTWGDSTHHSWQSFLEQEVKPLVGFFEEDGQYLELPWRPSGEVVFDKVPPAPNQLSEKPLSCPDKTLWPTHPQQYTKEYLFAVSAPFDRLRLPPDMSSCITPNPTRRYCLRAQDANVMVLSDTYEDTCGNLYRGYWVVTFRSGGGPLRSEDNMGTLLAKGRTQYEKPHAEFPGEMITGYTYGVDVKNFIFLSQLLPGDKIHIESAVAEANRQGFTRRGRSFEPKP